MANNDDTQLDDYDFDDDLNFNDDFNFDDFDSKPDDRKPIAKVYTGTIKGIRTNLVNPETIERHVVAALPDEYKTVYKAGKQLKTVTTDLYDEAVREVKPQLSRVARSVNKLIPEKFTKLKKVSNDINERLKEDDAYKPRSDADRQTDSINLALDSIFNKQTNLDLQNEARASVKEDIKENIEGKRFNSSFGLLTSSNRSLEKLVSFNDNINFAYQKKSLELQYRSYFIQSENLALSKKYFEIFDRQNQVISKNTSLPEFVKIKNSERFKEIAIGKFMGRVQESIMGDKMSDLVDGAAKNLKQKGSNLIQALLNRLDNAEMLVDEAGMAIDQVSMLGDAGGMDAWETAGESIGDYLSDAGVGSFRSTLKEKLESNDKVKQLGYELKDFINNPSGTVDGLKRSQFINENSYRSGAKGWLATGANMFLDLFDTKKKDLTFNNTGGLGIDPERGMFNDKTQKSIVSVIPGYLARIYREIAMMRTGNNAEELLMYDFDRDRFSTKSRLASDLKSRTTIPFRNNNFKRNSDEAYKNFVGDQQFTPEEELEIRRFLHELSFSKKEHTVENIKNSTARGNLTAGTTVKVDSIVRSKLVDDVNRRENRSSLTRDLARVRDASPDIMGQLEKLIEAGYGELLEEEKIIKRNADGKLLLNEDRYQEWLLEETNITTSDINVKTKIKAFKPKDALNRIKNTKIYDWFYKKGKGDTQQHTGPMAQDVNKNFGEETAPDGTKIDLTTMNGINMSAIQGLKEQQDEFFNGEHIEVLKLIREDVCNIYNLLDKGKKKKGKKRQTSNQDYDEVDSDQPEPKRFFDKSLGSLVAEALEFGVKFPINTLKALGSMVGFTGNKVVKPTYEYLTEVFKDNKDTVKEGLFSIFQKGMEITGDILSVAKKTITEFVPNTYRQAFGLLKKGYNALGKAIQPVVDVYRSTDMSTPILNANLMKAGFYLDQVTGNVIESFEDIKGVVVDREGNVVLTLDMIKEGLVDRSGKQIKTLGKHLLDKIINIGMNGFSRLSNAVGLAGNVFNKLKKDVKLPNFNLDGFAVGGEKLYNVVVEIRDLIKNKGSNPTFNDLDDSGERDGDGIEALDNEVENNETVRPDKPTNRYGSSSNILDTITGKISSFARRRRGAGGLVAGAASALAPTEEKKEDEVKETVETPEEEKKEDPILKKIYKVRKRSREGTWNDRDGSGRRDGSWVDQLEEMKEKKDEKAKVGDLSSRYASKENIIDVLAGKAGKFLDFIKNGVGGALGAIGGVIGTVGGFLGLGGAGGILGSIGTRIGSIATTARGMMTGGTVARSALGLATTARNVATVGAVATGGITSIAASAASIALTGLTAALASPVLLPAVVLAAVSGSAYYLYKSATKNSLTEFERFRLYQYGFTNSDRDRRYNHVLLELEKYLLDGKIIYQSGIAFIDEKRVDPEKLLAMFSIDKGDDEAVDNFKRWFLNRFKPFFLTHVSALFAVNPKLPLEDIEKLTGEEQLRFVSLVSYESGPYEESTSPFKDLDYVSTDKSQLKSIVDGINEEAKEDVVIKESVFDPTKKVRDLFKKEPPKVEQKDTIEKPVTPPTYNTAYDNKNLIAEDGKGYKTNLNIPKDAISIGGSFQIPEAGGPLSNGEGGDQYIKLGENAKLAGLNPALLRNLKAMAQEYGEKTGKSIFVTSGFRSYEDQARIKKQYPTKAADPGTSQHEFGLALDIDHTQANELEKLGLMRKYGFTRPVGGEPHHVEPAGIQSVFKQVRNDKMLATQLIEGGVFMGGGGLGSIPGTKLGTRSVAAAKKAANSAGRTVSDNKSIVSNPLFNKQIGDKASVVETRSPLMMGGGYAGNMNSVAQGVNELATLSDSPQSKVGNVGKGKNDVKEKIKSASSEVKMDPNLMLTMAAVESGLNPNSNMGGRGAKGLFQFLDGTWREQLDEHGRDYGIPKNAQPNDIRASTILAGEYLKKNTSPIKSIKGNITAGDAYSTHLLGPGGGLSMAKADPNAKAASVVDAKAVRGNKPFFYNGSSPVTVDGFYKNLDNHLKKKASEFGITPPSTLSKGMGGSTTQTEMAVNDSTFTQPSVNKANNVRRNNLNESRQLTSDQPVNRLDFDQNTPLSAGRKRLDKGQEYGSGEIAAEVKDIGLTLDKSLDIQTQMLAVLKEIAKTNPEVFNAAKEEVAKPQNVTARNTPRPAPKPGVDLKRQSV